MLQLAKSLLNIPVMSLRTGSEVARAERPIINPNNLKIEGWYCRDHFSKKDLILLIQDVRDIIPQGLAVDDHGALTEPDELIRLKDVLSLNFELIGKPVVTDSKRRIGKVGDYAVDTSSFFIKKLYISQPVYKTIAGGQLSIDRTQIIEITMRQITVSDTDQKVRSTAAALAGA